MPLLYPKDMLSNSELKQAGAELSQAQLQLGLALLQLICIKLMNKKYTSWANARVKLQNLGSKNFWV